MQQHATARLLSGAGAFYANPAVAYGRIYASNVNGRVIALDARTGSVAWVRVLGDWAYSSPAVNAPKMSCTASRTANPSPS